MNTADTSEDGRCFVHLNLVYTFTKLSQVTLFIGLYLPPVVLSKQSTLPEDIQEKWEQQQKKKDEARQRKKRRRQEKQKKREEQALRIQV